jgi:hypothetical protein
MIDEIPYCSQLRHLPGMQGVRARRIWQGRHHFGSPPLHITLLAKRERVDIQTERNRVDAQVMEFLNSIVEAPHRLRDGVEAAQVVPNNGVRRT